MRASALQMPFLKTCRVFEELQKRQGNGQAVRGVSQRKML
jgi:hypothetical protein